ncbi:MAG: succinate--CoA ligase subunit alpha [Deltaproteobacteria bacterium]|nr:succinate--CoA ligase subunit alpha [Deltaproteobacteria bacterium]
MAILVNKKTRVLTQGITGAVGQFHTRICQEYGTQMVAGVTPGKANSTFEGIPVFHTVARAVEATDANASVIYVPPSVAADAIMEAAEAGLELILCITEGIPIRDMVRVKRYLQGKSSNFIGPNCPGIITPGECKIGIMPGQIYRPGPVGVVSRSGTLTYEAVDQLSRLELGQSTCVGIGGDPVRGMGFIEILKLFNEDPATRTVVMIGEIGGSAEEEAAVWIKANMRKPVTGFIVGQTAPSGKRMGHAGAIISGGKGTAKDKVDALKKAGVRMASSPAVIGQTVKEVLRESGH